MDTKWRTALPWTLSAVVSALAIYVWGQSFSWNWSILNPYLFFPVLGLLAWSNMWSHYMVGAVKNSLFKDMSLTSYFRYTGYLVLACILFHPGILIYQLFRDGFGLPPGSYAHFVAPGMEWLVLLGTASLFAFLAFELHRWYGRKPWWKYVIAAGDVAMLAIFYHGLRLGIQLQSGWYHTLWLFYGLLLFLALARKYTLLILRKSGVSQTTNW